MGLAVLHSGPCEVGISRNLRIEQRCLAGPMPDDAQTRTDGAPGRGGQGCRATVSSGIGMASCGSRFGASVQQKRPRGRGRPCKIMRVRPTANMHSPGFDSATELYRALRPFKIANGPWLTRVLSIGYVLIQPFLAPPSHGWAPWAGSSALKLGSRSHSHPQHLIVRHLLF